MKRSSRILCLVAGFSLLALSAWAIPGLMPEQQRQPWSGWLVNDVERPVPPRVVPAEVAGGAPSDAVVLFDGSNLDAWEGGSTELGGKWVLRDGAMVAQGVAADIRTKAKFGSCQLHVEYRVDPQRKVHDQGGANSGVFLQDVYEIQINQGGEENRTYADGMAGAIYGQQPPLADAGYAQGQWQSFDILFRAPRLAEDGTVADAGLITVLMNGVCVQHGVALRGSTEWRELPKWERVPTEGPVRLQFHGDPVEFRNIWIRPLADAEADFREGRLRG